jgi:hypothetical protein
MSDYNVYYMLRGSSELKGLNLSVTGRLDDWKIFEFVVKNDHPDEQVVWELLTDKARGKRVSIGELHHAKERWKISTVVYFVDGSEEPHYL